MVKILYRLGQSLQMDEDKKSGSSVLRDEAAIQADAWEKLGKWASDQSIEDEIASLYEARSGGRDVDVSCSQPD